GLLDFRDHRVRARFAGWSLDDRDEILEFDGHAVGIAAAHEPYAVRELLRSDTYLRSGRGAHAVGNRHGGVRHIHLRVSDPHFHPVMAAWHQGIVTLVGVTAERELGAAAHVAIVAVTDFDHHVAENRVRNPADHPLQQVVLVELAGQAVLAHAGEA